MKKAAKYGKKGTGKPGSRASKPSTWNKGKKASNAGARVGAHKGFQVAADKGKGR